MSGTICLAALFALVRRVLAVQDAYAYSLAGGVAREMTVTYAGLEALRHLRMPAPRRLCLVALDDGTARYAARLDGRACKGRTSMAPNSAADLLADSERVARGLLGRFAPGERSRSGRPTPRSGSWCSSGPLSRGSRS